VFTDAAGAYAVGPGEGIAGYAYGAPMIATADTVIREYAVARQAGL
jgi:hypothetical protein